MASYEPTAIAASYAPVAEDYARQFGNNLETQPFDGAIVGHVLADATPGGLVLDAGCGPGQGAGFAEARGFHAIGLDVTPEMLEVARPRCSRLVRADLRVLPFAPQSFDAVIAWFSLLHLPRASMPDALMGLRAVMRPGAPLVIALQGGHGDEIQDNGVGWCRYECADIIGLLRAAGFTDVVARTRPPEPHEFPAQKVIASARLRSRPV